MKRRIVVLSFAVVLLALASCGATGGGRKVRVDYPKERTPGGVVLRDLALGQGPPSRPGDELDIHYVARLPDGRKVDSTHERGVAVTFVLGEAKVEGWNEGLLGMQKGGERWLRVPAALAYGSEGVPGLVPPDTDLEFEVELVEIRPDGERPPEGAE